MEWDEIFLKNGNFIRRDIVFDIEFFTEYIQINPILFKLAFYVTN